MEIEECSICLETWIDKTKGRVFINVVKTAKVDIMQHVLISGIMVLITLFMKTVK